MLPPIEAPVVVAPPPGQEWLYPIAEGPKDENDDEARRKRLRLLGVDDSPPPPEPEPELFGVPQSFPWTYLFLGLMGVYVMMFVASRLFKMPLVMVPPGILIAFVGYALLLIYAFQDHIVEGLLCVPGIVLVVIGLIIPMGSDSLIVMLWNFDAYLCILCLVLAIVLPSYLLMYVKNRFDAVHYVFYLFLIGILFQVTGTAMWSSDQMALEAERVRQQELDRARRPR
jgi:hypothetical protein